MRSNGTGSSGGASNGRWWRVGTVVVVGVMLLPVVLDRDSFPLSTYPMYSRARTAEVTIPTRDRHRRQRR